MARSIVECVPNFSEGRDAGKIDAIAAAALSVAGVALLDREADADHNRCVLTLAGPPEEVAEAALRAAAKAVELIDLNVHTGVHPRIGAVDVVPFVPVEGITLDECVQLAVRAGEELWRRCAVPVYLYEAAARRADRANLENIRRGQFEGLREEAVANPERAPDIGGPALHATAGAAVVGARKFLIAYNINLGTPDVEIAKRVAKAVRFSSGGFRFVKAMGVPLASRNQAQVSMNLTDFEQTPVHRVFEAVKREAARCGVPVASSEIVGLIPRKALEMAADYYLQCENFHAGLVLENRLEAALEAGRRHSGLGAFLNALAAPTATPGGGSAAAAAGAMAAALGTMVARLGKLVQFDFEEDRRFLTAAVERDAAAFEKVMAAYKRPKTERAPFVEEAMHGAALVPLEVAERAAGLGGRLAALAEAAPARFSSDVASAKALADAAKRGALANVRINLESITDAQFRAELEARLASIE